MARRRKRRGGRRGRGALPLVQTVMVAYPALTAYQSAGFSKDLPKHIVYQYTGYDPSTGRWDSPMKGAALAIGLLVASTVGTKIANRVGVNRIAKKASGGLLKLM